MAERAVGVLAALEPMPMYTLLFHGPDQALDHAVLLRTMRRDELLVQAVATNQPCAVTAGEDQAVIGPQQQWFWDPPKRSEASNRSRCERSPCGACLAAAGQMTSEKFPRMAVNDERQSLARRRDRPIQIEKQQVWPTPDGYDCEALSVD